MAESESAQLQACEYVLIRIAPDPVRHEQLNLGVALFQPGAGGFAGVRCNRDYRRAACLFPQFNPADLAGLEAELQAKLADREQRDYFVALAEETFSHSLQVSAPTRVLTRDPAAELERLFETYAATPAPAPHAERAAGPRRQVLREMEQQLREAGVLHRLERGTRVGEWLGNPDDFRVDFSYQPNGTRHILQALPLESDASVIKEFCFTVGRIRARMASLDAAGVTGFSDAGEAAPRRYHRDLLLNAGIRVLDIGQMAAESARIRAALR